LWFVPANVNGGWVGRRQELRIARVDFVDLAGFSLAKSTLGPYSVHFVDVARIRMTKSTLCTLTAANPSSLPTQPPLTFARGRRADATAPRVASRLQDGPC
jgi:hypothetical protein